MYRTYRQKWNPAWNFSMKSKNLWKTSPYFRSPAWTLISCTNLRPDQQCPCRGSGDTGFWDADTMVRIVLSYPLCLVLQQNKKYTKIQDNLFIQEKEIQVIQSAAYYSSDANDYNSHVLVIIYSWLDKYRNVPKLSDRQVWANSADPDQTAPWGAIWSGFALFAIPSASFGFITLRKSHLVQL